LSKAGIMYPAFDVSKHPPWAGARTGLPAWHEDDAAEASSSSQLAREVVPAPRMLPHFLHLQSRPSHFPPHCTHQAQEEPLVSAAAVDRPNRQLLERGVWGSSTQRNFVSLPVLPSSKTHRQRRSSTLCYICQRHGWEQFRRADNSPILDPMRALRPRVQF
jgi:hypothetical protein